MLVGVAKMFYKVMVASRINQVVVFFGKRKRTAHVDGRQAKTFGVRNHHYMLIICFKTSPCFVANICTGLTIANNLSRLLHIYGAVICGNNKLIAFLLCSFNAV